MTTFRRALQGTTCFSSRGDGSRSSLGVHICPRNVPEQLSISSPISVGAAVGFVQGNVALAGLALRIFGRWGSAMET